MNGGIMKGFTLAETLLVLVIMAIALPTFYNLVDMGITAQNQKAAAKSLELVAQASEEYLQKNINDLQTSCTENSGQEISVTELQTANLLPKNFNPKNVFGQDYRIYFRKQDNNLLAIVLTYNGRDVDPKFANVTIPNTAGLLSYGAFIPTGSVPNQNPEHLYGVAGTYALDLAAMNIANPTSGHLGAVTFFDTKNLAQDFLYRYEITGQPELNTMFTELNMSDNAIEKVGALGFSNKDIALETCETEKEGQVLYDQAQGLYICRENKFELVLDTKNSVNNRDLIFAKNYDLIKKPICSPNLIPKIYLSPSILAAGEKSPSIVAIQSWATEVDPDTWQIFLRLLTSDSKQTWIYPTEEYARMLVFTTCQD